MKLILTFLGQRARRPRPQPQPQEPTLINSIPLEPIIPTVQTSILPQQQPIRLQQVPLSRAPTTPAPTTPTTPEPQFEPRIVNPATFQPNPIQQDVPRSFPRKFEVIKPNKDIAKVNAKNNHKKKLQRIPVLDRYTIQNDDGSLTWGYQSADGSFKEETIGNDCVTSGR